MRRLAWALVIGLILTPVRLGAEESPRPGEVKARLLLSFLDFVEWPEQSFSSEDTPISVAVIGEDPFEGHIEQTFRDQRAQGRSIVVRQSPQAEDLSGCHVVYVSPSERNRVAEVLAVLDGKPILTVSELPGFCSHGGVLNFFVEDQKVRFEANPSEAKRRAIRLSAHLLQRARVVGT